MVSSMSPAILGDLLAARAASPEGDPMAGNRPYLAAWSKSDACPCARTALTMGLTAAESALEEVREEREEAAREKEEARALAAGEPAPRSSGPCQCFNYDTLDIYHDPSNAQWQKQVATAPYKVFIYNLNPEVAVKELLQGLCKTGRAVGVEIFREQITGTGAIRYVIAASPTTTAPHSIATASYSIATATQHQDCITQHRASF
jgi:hypothetical protein